MLRIELSCPPSSNSDIPAEGGGGGWAEAQNRCSNRHSHSCGVNIVSFICAFTTYVYRFIADEKATKQQDGPKRKCHEGAMLRLELNSSID